MIYLLEMNDKTEVPEDMSHTNDKQVIKSLWVVAGGDGLSLLRRLAREIEVILGHML